MSLDRDIFLVVLKEFELDKTFNFVYLGDDFSSDKEIKKNETLNYLVEEGFIELIDFRKNVGSRNDGEFLFKLTDSGCELLNDINSQGVE